MDESPEGTEALSLLHLRQFLMMEESIVGVVFRDDALSDVRSVIGDAVGGLVGVARMLEAYDAGDTSISRGHLEMIARTVLNGSVDVWYRGRYVTIPLRRLSDWFHDPVEIGAATYQVDEPVFRRWMNCDHENGVGMTFVPCSHKGCRQQRVLSFYDPHEMQQMESRAASEVWYCHHHRLNAWKASGALSDEHRALLERARDNSGCSREQLGGQKRDTDFLMSIGLLTTPVLATGNRRSYSFKLTAAGMEVVRTQSNFIPIS